MVTGRLDAVAKRADVVSSLPPPWKTRAFGDHGAEEALESLFTFEHP